MRDQRFDAIKAIAIFMVVLGHVTSNSEIGCNPEWLGTFIVGVNMPLFFAVSGYFSVRAVDSFAQAIHRVLSYLRSMFSYGAVIAILLGCVGVYGTWQEILKRAVSLPVCGWWYMWSLIYSILFMSVIYCVRKRLRKTSVVVFLVSYFIVMLLPDSWYQVKFFKFCFPFFVLGYTANKCNFLSFMRKNFSTLLVWVLCASAYFVFSLFEDGCAIGFYWGDYSLLHIIGSWKSLFVYGERYLAAAAGIVTIVVPILLLGQGRVFGFISRFGKTTMGVYFVHQTIIAVLLEPAFRGANRHLHNLVALAVLLWLVCHLIVTAKDSVLKALKLYANEK